MIPLETSRLILRKWEMNDVDDLYEYAKNPKVGPNAGWPPHKNKEDSVGVLQRFIKSNTVWSIEYKEDRKVIGSIDLHYDDKRIQDGVRSIGYVLSEPYWGRGIAVEAVQEVLRYCFEVGQLRLVTIYHYPHNLQSKRVIEKCGFHFEGVLRCATKIYDETIYDDYCYSMTLEEYVAIYKKK